MALDNLERQQRATEQEEWRKQRQEYDVARQRFDKCHREGDLEEAYKILVSEPTMLQLARPHEIQKFIKELVGQRLEALVGADSSPEDRIQAFEPWTKILPLIQYYAQNVSRRGPNPEDAYRGVLWRLREYGTPIMREYRDAERYVDALDLIESFKLMENINGLGFKDTRELYDIMASSVRELLQKGENMGDDEYVARVKRAMDIANRYPREMDDEVLNLLTSSAK